MLADRHDGAAISQIGKFYAIGAGIIPGFCAGWPGQIPGLLFENPPPSVSDPPIP